MTSFCGAMIESRPLSKSFSHMEMWLNVQLCRDVPQRRRTVHQMMRNGMHSVQYRLSRRHGMSVVAATMEEENGTSSSGDGENEELTTTTFVAETTLPTTQGKFRLRGYRHSVGSSSFIHQLDGIVRCMVLPMGLLV